VEGGGGGDSTSMPSCFIVVVGGRWTSPLSSMINSVCQIISMIAVAGGHSTDEV